jgi:hypothetical protein
LFSNSFPSRSIKVIEVLVGEPSQGGNNLAPGLADCGAEFAARAAKVFQASGALRDIRQEPSVAAGNSVSFAVC